MLQGSTLCSGITAGHDTPYRFLTVDLPRSAPLRDQCLRYLGEGALGAASPNASSPRCAPSSLPFGRDSPVFSCLRSRAFERILFAFTVCFAIPLRVLARSRMPSATGKGGVPNSSPSRSRLFLGAAAASTDARAKPRPLSATPRTFACERLGFLQFEKNPEGFFLR